MAVVVPVSSWLRTFVLSVVVLVAEPDEGSLDTPDKSSRDDATASCSRLWTALSAADVTPNPMDEVLLFSNKGPHRFDDSSSVLDADVSVPLLPVFSRVLEVLSAEAAVRESCACLELCTSLSILLGNGEMAAIDEEDCRCDSRFGSLEPCKLIDLVGESTLPSLDDVPWASTSTRSCRVPLSSRSLGDRENDLRVSRTCEPLRRRVLFKELSSSCRSRYRPLPSPLRALPRSL